MSRSESQLPAHDGVPAFDPDFENPELDRIEHRPRLASAVTRPPRASLGRGGGGFMAGQQAPAEMEGLAPPFELAVLAGGCASAAVDITIYPLDTLKTRLQAPQGFRASGGYRGLFTGVTAAALGAVPGGAVFFGAYEFSRSELQKRREGSAHWTLDAVAGCTAATASCLIRTPAIVVQQRMQVGQFHGLGAAIEGVAREGGISGFYSGLGVSIAREIPFAFIQFPIYEGLKRLWLSHTGGNELNPSQGAVCGSIAGAVAAAATTPLDLLKTRQMIGQTPDGLVAETRKILHEEGAAGLLKGVGPRVGWMAVGGYIFFGMYEGVMQMLLAVRRGSRQQEDAPNGQKAPTAVAHPGSFEGATLESPPSSSSSLSSAPAANAADAVPPEVALLAGGIAGMAIDLVLYPIDTLKTRTMQGLATSGSAVASGFGSKLRELYGLFHGVGAALLPAIPAASVFFVTYESVKARVVDDEGGSSLGYFIAAGVAEGASCLVRVPAEFLKMKLQVSQSSTLRGAVQAAWTEGGVFAFYRGLGATLCLDLPFALLQFPLYEYLKGLRRRNTLLPGGATIGESEDESAANTSRDGTDGAIAGAIAGATAAFCTTPLDVIRTRHVLWEGERQSLSATVASIATQDGLKGFSRGILPRTMQMGLGGALYLGTYSYATSVLQRFWGSRGAAPLSDQRVENESGRY